MWTHHLVALLMLALAGRAERPAPPMSPESVKFETADGVTIAADYYAPPERKNPAPVAVLIHMYPADRRSWKPLLPGLRREGFAVLAYDIRGTGGSTEPAEKKLGQKYRARDADHFAAAWRDVEAAKKWLGGRHGLDVKRLVLVGASVGCSIALDDAARDNDVKAVICLSPGTNYMGLNSRAHIKKCGHCAILLVSPEAEYSAVEELVQASAGRAHGQKYPGGPELHGTGLISDRGPDRARVLASILAHSRKATGERFDGAPGP